MVIIEDTRNKVGKHDIKHESFKEMGITLYRCKLPFGDYAIWGCPRSVDTKQNLYELAQNIDQEHERFRNEQVNARDAGCELIFLTENNIGIRSLADLEQWDETLAHFEMRKSHSGNPHTRRISGKRLARACATMSERYGASFEFCSPEESAERIVQLLTEGGEADDIQG